MKRVPSYPSTSPLPGVTNVQGNILLECHTTEASSKTDMAISATDIGTWWAFSVLPIGTCLQDMKLIRRWSIKYVRNSLTCTSCLLPKRRDVVTERVVCVIWARGRIAAVSVVQSLDVQHGSAIRARKYGTYAPDEVVQHLQLQLLLLSF